MGADIPKMLPATSCHRLILLSSFVSIFSRTKCIEFMWTISSQADRRHNRKIQKPPLTLATDFVHIAPHETCQCAACRNSGRADLHRLSQSGSDSDSAHAHATTGSRNHSLAL